MKRQKGKGNHKYKIYDYGDFIIYHRFGKIHRDEGPAYYDKTKGNKIYYQFGRIHRVDGPAVIEKDGDELFYWYDTPMEFDSWIKWTTAPEEKKAELILKYG